MFYKRIEQETTVVWNEAEKMAMIYSASPSVMRKLDALVAQYPGVYQRIWVENGGTAAKYTVDSKFVRFCKPASEAQREAGRRLAGNLRSAAQKA